MTDLRNHVRGNGMPTTNTVPETLVDTQSQDFADECRRQSRLVEQDQHEQEMLDWLQQVADTDGWVVSKE